MITLSTLWPVKKDLTSSSRVPSGKPRTSRPWVATLGSMARPPSPGLCLGLAFTLISTRLPLKFLPFASLSARLASSTDAKST